eukprot:TRINITY_DN26871_c0_g1_i1.p1 TRINITY_DN26871_c0_g1~~TRINITY_DN26871_c0_g1_i1.p1  ORF type:complete len:588 (+),score=104.56 TRINITY_DN26871_c0_g1_i1:95-1858(+)
MSYGSDPPLFYSHGGTSERADEIDKMHDNLFKDQFALISKCVNAQHEEIGELLKDVDGLKVAHERLSSEVEQYKGRKDLGEDVDRLRQDFDGEKQKRLEAAVSTERQVILLTDRIAEALSSTHTHRQKMDIHVDNHRKETKQTYASLSSVIDDLQQRVIHLSAGLAEIKELKGLVLNANKDQEETLKVVHDSHRNSVAELLALERAARENAVNDIHAHFSRLLNEEKLARDSREASLHQTHDDRLKEERVDREKHLSSLAELINSERTKREKLGATLKEQADANLAEERKERETALAEMRGMLSRERSARQGATDVYAEVPNRLAQIARRLSTVEAKLNIEASSSVGNKDDDKLLCPGALEGKLMEAIRQESKTRAAQIAELRAQIGVSGEVVSAEHEFASVQMVEANSSELRELLWSERLASAKEIREIAHAERLARERLTLLVQDALGTLEERVLSPVSPPPQSEFGDQAGSQHGGYPSVQSGSGGQHRERPELPQQRELRELREREQDQQRQNLCNGGVTGSVVTALSHEYPCNPLLRGGRNHALPWAKPTLPPGMYSPTASSVGVSTGAADAVSPRSRRVSRQ